MSDERMPLTPLTLTFVGSDRGGTSTPTGWQIADHVPTAGEWTFMGMSIIERAVLRALCHEALRRLDSTEAEDALK